MSNNEQTILVPEVHGRVFTPKEMLAIGALATVAASGMANYFNGEDGRPEMPAFDIEWTNAHHQANVLDKDIIIPDGSGGQVTVVDGRPTTEEQTLTDTMDEEWARRFAHDVHAGHLINPEEIDTFADRVQAEMKDGWQLDAVSVRGTTSAEDDSVNAQGERTAGLQDTTQTAAEQQEELGNRRRDIGALQLAVALEERGISIDPAIVEQLPSVEDVLTDDETQQVEALANQFGYDNVTEMIEMWNRDPDSSPPAVDQTLTELLAKERTFQVEVDFSRSSQSTEETTDGPGHDSNPTGHPIEKEVQNKVRIFPLLIPGYIFITLGRRRMPSSPDTVPTRPVSGPGPDPGPTPRPVLPPRKLPRPGPTTPPVEIVDGGGRIPAPIPITPRLGLRDQTNFERTSRKGQQAYEQSDMRRRQPRNHNFSKQTQRQGGRMPRNHGGDRRSKRA